MSKNLWKEAQKELFQDKYIAPLIKKYGNCKLEKQPKSRYFEILVREIVGQQISIKAAATIYQRLKDKLKGEVTPENILRAKNDTLRSCGFSRAKAVYAKDLAARVKDGRLEINKLDKLKDEEVMKELIAVKGIGPWTAEMFLMFSLARPDIFPVDDLGIRNGMEELLDKKMSEEEMVEFARRWEPWRTVASWYIWELLDNK